MGKDYVNPEKFKIFDDSPTDSARYFNFGAYVKHYTFYYHSPGN